MGTYVKRSKDEFEVHLACIVNTYGGAIRDLTDAYHARKGSWERVYELTTSHPGVRLLVFSSIDIRTGEFRECGGDAVRIDRWMKTAKGNIGYRKVKTHPRIGTLFFNMEKTVLEVNEWVLEDGGSNVNKWAWGVDKYKGGVKDGATNAG
jgi:hypothetical protein